MGMAPRAGAEKTHPLEPTQPLQGASPASAPKSRLPLVFSSPSSWAGWRDAASRADSTLQPAQEHTVVSLDSAGSSLGRTLTPLALGDTAYHSLPSSTGSPFSQQTKHGTLDCVQCCMVIDPPAYFRQRSHTWATMSPIQLSTGTLYSEQGLT